MNVTQPTAGILQVAVASRGLGSCRRGFCFGHRAVLPWAVVIVCQLASLVRAAPVHPWQTVEITLQAVREYEDAYAGEQVWVDLQGPEFSKRCHGFWDGGSTFRVRVMATAPGTWTWRSGSKLDDPGLSGKSGTLTAISWTEDQRRANPNRRGQVRIAAGGRYFEYADGTPFFLLADTLWAGNTARCGLGAGSDGPFFQYLADRQAKGFTAVLMQLIHGYGDYPNGQAHRNEGGYAFLDRDPAKLNPAYFQALDRRMAAVRDHGFVAAVPVMWWGKTKQCLFTPEQARRISAYCAARYGTFNSLWNVSGEYQYTLGDCGWTPADLTALGNTVQRYNPWKHPLSIHPSSRTNWKAPHNRQSSSPFHGESWLDHHWLQTGQTTNQLFNIVTRLDENRDLKPPVPVFLSEAWYERTTEAESTYLTRWQVWTAFLNGAAGYGYGAWGLWQFFDPDDPHGEPGKITSHPTTAWREAIRLPGSAQVRHARTILESLDWWNLQPCRDVLQVDGRPNRLPTGTDLSPPHAAAIGDGTWIVYVPRGNRNAVISLDHGTAARINAQWFDPRQGILLERTLTLPATTRRLPPQPAPADEDWVLILKQDG
jgi:hypothetical protein